MPTGPDHYREAERLAEQLRDCGPDWARDWGALVGARAQVHATLALAAATALTHVGECVIEIEKDATDWARAIGAMPESRVSA